MSALEIRCHAKRGERLCRRRLATTDRDTIEIEPGVRWHGTGPAGSDGMTTITLWCSKCGNCETLDVHGLTQGVKRRRPGRGAARERRIGGER